MSEVPPRRTRLVSMVTNEDLSTQLTLLRRDMTDNFSALSSELSVVRNAVMTDHGPRITAVEKTVGSKVVGATKWIGLASLALTIAAQIAAAFRPDLVGPIQTILAVLTGGAP